MLLYIVWDHSKEMFSFSLPFLNRPILWYGFFFAFGFFLGAILLVYLLNRYYREKHLPQTGKELVEKALVYAMLGTILGARIADVLFYQDIQTILDHPLSLFAVWQGGLSSHGGTIGALCSLFFFAYKEKKRLKNITFFRFLDFTATSATIIAGFIRIGNFFNQEILGVQTDLPIGVIFAHPIDGSAPVARHPVQLYEALFYWSLCIVLLRFIKKKKWAPGQLASIAVFAIYMFRFGIEFLKEEQSVYETIGGLTMGQYLSIPLILASIGAFFFFGRKKR